MRKLFFIPFLFLPLTTMAACSSDDTPALQTEQPTTPDDPDNPSGNSKTLVAYFSAQGHTQAVAERIVELTGADIYRIEAADPYAENPYDDSDRIQNEAYNDLRPGVANLPDKEIIAQYDTIFVGSPCWWHQPAMVVCTFLEAYDLKDKVVIPFFTYGATTYLNESSIFQKRFLKTSIRMTLLLPARPTMQVLICQAVLMARRLGFGESESSNKKHKIRKR